MTSWAMKACIVITVTALAPAAARAQQGTLVNDTVVSAGLEGNVVGASSHRAVVVYLPPS